MRKTLCYALAAALAVLAYGADTPTPAKKAPAPVSAAKAPAKKGAAPAAARKAPAKSPAKRTTAASSRTKSGKKPAPRTTWRNRQTAPSPERYKEIQGALVAKGYLKAGDTGSGWNQNSVDALKHFQEDQKIENSGKINSLSLIALGLGPKREPVPPKPADPGSSPDRE